RRVPIDGAERTWRVVHADAGPAELPHDAVAADPDDAAVVGVCDLDLPVRQRIGVVRRVKETRTAAGHARNAVEMDAAVGPDVDRDDRVRLLLVRDDR